MAITYIQVLAEAIKEKNGKFEYYQNTSSKEWYWRYVSAGNHKIMADGGGYDSKQALLKALEVLKIQVSTATIVEVTA